MFYVFPFFLIYRLAWSDPRNSFVLVVVVVRIQLCRICLKYFIMFSFRVLTCLRIVLHKYFLVLLKMLTHFFFTAAVNEKCVNVCNGRHYNISALVQIFFNCIQYFLNVFLIFRHAESIQLHNNKFSIVFIVVQFVEHLQR